MSIVCRGRLYHSVGEDLIMLIKASYANLSNVETIKEFEEAFADYNNSKWCTAFPFARTALWAIFQSIGLKSGDKVVMPCITIKGMLDVCANLELQPVFADLDIQNASVDVEKIDSLLKFHKPKALIATYLFGNLPNLPLLAEICRVNDVLLVEDFSQALNSEFDNTKVGNFGIAGIYSASATKTLDLFGGGLAITNNSDIRDKLRKLQSELSPPSRLHLIKKSFSSLAKNLATRSLLFPLLFLLILLSNHRGSDRFTKFVGKRPLQRQVVLPKVWFTSFTSLQAKFGLMKLNHVLETDNNRIQIAQAYDEGLNKNIQVLRTKKGSRSTRWQYLILVDQPKLVLQALNRVGVDVATTSLSFLPSLLGFGIQSKDVEVPTAKYIHEHAVYLPCYPGIELNKQKQVINVLNHLCEKKMI